VTFLDFVQATDLVIYCYHCGCKSSYEQELGQVKVGQVMPAAKNSSAGQPDDRLESWKEIAVYLNCSERTAKRWEKARQLPVRRLPGGSGGVFAYRQEVAAWRDGGEPLAEDRTESSDTAVELLPQVKQPPGSKRLRRWALYAAATLLLLSVAGGVRALHVRRPIAAKVIGQNPPREAQDLYLRGRFYWNKRTPADLTRAMNDFKAASSLDPNYADPYAGMADVYALSPPFASTPPAEAFPRMLDFARRSLALNPDLPEGHRALGFALFYWDWNRAESRKEFERAMELNPNDATTLHWYANVLQQSQDIPAALVLIERARQMEPTDRSILYDRASILAYLGRTAEANEAWDAIEASEPTYLPPHWHRSEVAHHAGNAKVYLGELNTIAAMTHSPDDLSRYRISSAAYRRGGWAAVLNAAADLDMEFARLHGFGYITAAIALDEASRDAEALDFVELAYQHRDPAFPLVANPDHFLGLQENARFKGLKARSLVTYAGVDGPTKRDS
jgi:tetratricopeptide (TPR) repeat protein